MADFAYVSPTSSTGGRDFSGNHSSSFIFSNTDCFEQDQSFQASVSQSELQCVVLPQQRRHDSMFEQLQQLPNDTQVALSPLLHQPQSRSHSQMSPHNYSPRSTSMSRNTSQYSYGSSNYMKRRASHQTAPFSNTARLDPMSAAPSYQYEAKAEAQSFFSKGDFEFSDEISRPSRHTWASMMPNSQWLSTVRESHVDSNSMQCQKEFQGACLTKNRYHMKQASGTNNFEIQSFE